MSNGLTPGAVLPDFELPDDHRTKPDFDPTTPEARAAWEQANTAAPQPTPA